MDRGILEGVVETMPAEVAILDADGTIVYTNPRWESFGRENGLVGDPTSVGENYLAVTEAADDEDARAAAAGVRSILAGDEDVLRLEYPCHSPDEHRWFLMYACGFEHDGDQYVHMEHLDITDRKEAELRVREQNHRLETVASVLSHDLRNPLTVATGYLDLLERDHDLSGEYVGKIRSALDRMETIISDALVLARGPTVDELDDVDLESAARDAWANVATGDATLTVADSLRFEGDASLLGNLFENLYRNAVEHGGEGVSVRVGTLPDAAGFYVEDDGPGFPPDVRATGIGQTDEAGLGLSIVREIADVHGWDVTLTESASGGARVEFRGLTSVDD